MRVLLDDYMAGPKGALPGLQRREAELSNKVTEFINSYSNDIITTAAKGSLTPGQIGAIDGAIKGLDTFVAAELLLAVSETRKLGELTNGAFISSLQKFDAPIASALLYEIRLTWNTDQLTDSRLFAPETVRFFNSLGSESASEWFGSIGTTRNITALTSANVMTSEVSTLAAGDAKIASELSFAIGQTGSTAALTDSVFLNSLKAMKPELAADYLSAIWMTRNVEAFTDKSVINQIGSGRMDLWTDGINRYSNADTNMGSVMLSTLGEGSGAGHDRGVKLHAQSLLQAGYRVVYSGNATTASQIINTAVQLGVNAIGLSIMDDSYQALATNVAMAMNATGLNNTMTLFGGGIVSPNIVARLDQAGVRFFTPNGNMTNEVLNFLSVTTAMMQGYSGIYGSTSVVNAVGVSMSPSVSIGTSSVTIASNSIVVSQAGDFAYTFAIPEDMQWRRQEFLRSFSSGTASKKYALTLGIGEAKLKTQFTALGMPTKWQAKTTLALTIPEGTRIKTPQIARPSQFKGASLELGNLTCDIASVTIQKRAALQIVGSIFVEKPRIAVAALATNTESTSSVVANKDMAYVTRYALAQNRTESVTATGMFLETQTLGNMHVTTGSTMTLAATNMRIEDAVSFMQPMGRESFTPGIKDVRTELSAALLQLQSDSNRKETSRYGTVNISIQVPSLPGKGPSEPDITKQITPLPATGTALKSHINRTDTQTRLSAPKVQSTNGHAFGSLFSGLRKMVLVGKGR